MPDTDVHPCKSCIRYAFNYVKTHWWVTDIYKAIHKIIKNIFLYKFKILNKFNHFSKKCHTLCFFSTSYETSKIFFILSYFYSISHLYDINIMYVLYKYWNLSWKWTVYQYKLAVSKISLTLSQFKKKRTFEWKLVFPCKLLSYNFMVGNGVNIQFIYRIYRVI